MAHSHVAASSIEPEGRAARPHVHWGVAHHNDEHHDHESGDERGWAAESHEHDADAFCVGETRLLTSGRAELCGSDLSCRLVASDAYALANRVSLRQVADSLNTLRPQCARYLQLLSIRC